MAALDELGAAIDALGAEGFAVTAIVGTVGGSGRLDVDELDLLVRPGVAAATACGLVLVARFAALQPTLVLSCVDDRHDVVTMAARAAGCELVVAVVDRAPSTGRGVAVLEALHRRMPEGLRRRASAAAASAAPSRIVALGRATALRLAAHPVLEPRVVRLDAGHGVATDDLPDLAAAAALRHEARRRLGIADGARLVAVVGTTAQRQAAASALIRCDAGLRTVEAGESVDELEDATMKVVASDVVFVVGDGQGSPRVLMTAAVAGVGTVAVSNDTVRACVRDTETGLLAATVADGAAQVVRLLDRADERVAMGRRAQRYAVRLFDRDLAARRLVEVVRAAAGAEPPAPATIGGDGTIAVRGPGARDLLG